MINKIFKRLFNQYSNIFKFLFYIKYLFLIFFIATLIFLLIPKFFDYEKKQIYIKNYLNNNYNLNIKENEKVQFNIFPLPNLEISKVTLGFNKVSQIKASKIFHFAANADVRGGIINHEIDLNENLLVHSFQLFHVRFCFLNQSIFIQFGS